MEHALRCKMEHALRRNTKHALRRNTTQALRQKMKSALQPHEDLRASAYSEVNIDMWVEPTEGKRGMERDSTRRCSGRGDDQAKGGTKVSREGQNSTCNRSDLGPNRRTYTADNGKKCQRSNRSRSVKTRKRKQILIETDQSKPIRKGAESVKTNQPSLNRPNTN